MVMLPPNLGTDEVKVSGSTAAEAGPVDDGDAAVKLLVTPSQATRAYDVVAFSALVISTAAVVANVESLRRLTVLRQMALFAAIEAGYGVERRGRGEVARLTPHRWQSISEVDAP